ncbi:MAG: DnaA N-terminal domain-containing protein, partial [Anaerotignaceae bacterium]
MDYLEEIWAKALEVLETELELISYNTWIKPTKPLKIDGRDIILKAENQF